MPYDRFFASQPACQYEDFIMFILSLYAFLKRMKACFCGVHTVQQGLPSTFVSMNTMDMIQKFNSAIMFGINHAFPFF